MHDWINKQISELKTKQEQNEETIKRLQVENTEITKVLSELQIIK